MNKKLFLIILICILISPFFLYFNYFPLLKSWFADFLTNYQAGVFFWTAPEKLYAIIPYNGGYTYPPVVSMFYSVFSFITTDKYTARLLWIFTNYIFLFLTIFGIYKFYYRKIDFWFLIIVICVVFFKPLRDNLKYGNIKLILLCMFVFLFPVYERKKDILAGVIFGILIILSVQPIILSLYFLIKKKYKLIFSAALTGCFFMLLPILIASDNSELFFQTKKYLMVVLPNLFFEGASASPYIQSIDAMFKRLFLDHNEYTIEIYKSHFLALRFPLILKIVLLVSTFFALFKTRKTNKYSLTEFNFIFCFMVIVHSINWEYHYTILLFSLLLIIRDTNISIKSKIYLYAAFFLIFLPLPYDNKIFLKNNPLIIFSNIKLLLLFFIWATLGWRLFNSNN